MLILGALLSLIPIAIFVVSGLYSPSSGDFPYVDPTITPNYTCPIRDTARSRETELENQLQQQLDSDGLTAVVFVWEHLIVYGEVVCTDAHPPPTIEPNVYDYRLILEINLEVDAKILEEPARMGEHIHNVLVHLDKLNEDGTATFHTLIMRFNSEERTQEWRSQHWLRHVQPESMTEEDFVKVYNLGWRFPDD